MPLSPCSTNINFSPSSCSIAPGGISNIWIGDPTLFDFTQAAPSSNVVQPYTAITDLGTSSKLYPIKFEQMSAEYDATLKNDDGVSPGYTHQVMFNVPRVNMLSSQWQQLMNINGYCCGILIVIVTNAQDILIMGEASVNASLLIPKFYTYMDGTKMNTGKKGTEKNTTSVILKSTEYYRPLIQYTGALSTILALSN